MIEFQNVNKVFGETNAVDDISFHIKEGETFGLIGTSGCGKTTTLKMINRLIEPTSGSILINGREAGSQNPEALRHQMGYVIQNVGLFPHYTVKKNVGIVPGLLKWEEPRIVSRSRELLEMVGLDPEIFADRKPDSLSGGQQQRVGLARALAANPPIILMDEPFGALDPITKQQIRREVSQLFKQINKTIVLVTHDIVEAFEMCNRLCLIDNGRVQQIGTGRELLFYPANSVVESFFESNRFQLELLSITVGDILEPSDGKTELYWSPPLAEYEEIEIDLQTSLYTIIEKMEQSETENPVLIRRKDGQVMDSLKFTDLLNRFQHFKKELKRGDRDG